MQDYYTIYTWAMDRQADLERRAEERRLIREDRHVHLRLRWPLTSRRRNGVNG
jgi:hypothetical protein